MGDLPALLGRLRRRGYRLGVATMDETAVARETLVRLGIADEFTFLAGADAGFGEKPDPGMALAFCTACGLSPAEVIVVGDTPADLMMARNAACAAAIAVRTGATSLESLAALADHVLPSVQELERVL